MPLLQSLRDLFRTSDIAINEGDPMGFALLNRQSPPARFTQNFLRAYSEMPWLRATMGRIANSVASQQWILYQRKGGNRSRHSLSRVGDKAQRDTIINRAMRDNEWQEVEDHPLLALLEHGNGLLDGLTNRVLTQLYLDLVGEAFWIIEPAERSKEIQALWPIPPYWIEDIPQAQQNYYKVRFPTGNSFDLPAELMIHLRQSDPYDPYRRGKGITQALSDELEIDEFAAKFMRQWFFNSARPDILITGDGLGEAAMKNIEEKWERKTRGFWNAFKPLFMSKKVDVHELQSSLKDMDLSTIRAAERDIIVQVTGVSPEILGILTNSNRSTIDASDLHFSRYVLLPRLEFLKIVYNRYLTPIYGENLWLDYVSPVPEDREYKLKVYSAAPQAFFVDEWRALVQDDPLPDGLGQVRYGALNLVEIGSSPAATSQRDGAEQMALPVLPHKAVVPHVKGLGDDIITLIHRVADAISPRMQSSFISAVQVIRSAIVADALADALRTQPQDQVIASLPWGALDDGLGDISQLALKALDQSAQHAVEALASVDILVDWSLQSPEAIRYAIDHGSALITQISDETRAAIRNLVSDSMASGASIDDLAAQIKEHIGLTQRHMGAVERLRQQLISEGVSDTELARRVGRYAEGLLDLRAEMIARTESIDASNAGHTSVWEQAVREGKMRAEDWHKVWIVTNDDRLDQALCARMPYLDANKDVPPNGMFTTPDGRRVMGPTLHPMCRCVASLRRKV
jgi:HK97 family phage portal protein